MVKNWFEDWALCEVFDRIVRVGKADVAVMSGLESMVGDPSV